MQYCCIIHVVQLSAYYIASGLTHLPALESEPTYLPNCCPQITLAISLAISHRSARIDLKIISPLLRSPTTYYAQSKPESTTTKHQTLQIITQFCKLGQIKVIGALPMNAD